MHTRENAIATANLFIKDCSSLLIKIDKAVLFGSVVNGNSSSDSDIDLALFSDSFTNNILANIDLIGLINIRYPELDVHTFPSNYYYSKGMLLDEIKSTGIEISLVR